MQELEHATRELRELARGIHPAVLTDRGLHPAIRALADRMSIPVDVRAVPDRRLPGAVESAVYFVAAEALTNVAKYAQARKVSVAVTDDGRLIVVEVRDDGVGGASPDGGSGLSGLSDRVSALDGRLTLSSPSGEGTTVRAEIPGRSLDRGRSARIPEDRETAPADELSRSQPESAAPTGGDFG